MSTHACVSAPRASCWGRNDEGKRATRAKDAGPATVDPPVAVDLDLAAGGGHTCAVLSKRFGPLLGPTTVGSWVSQRPPG